MSVNSAHSELSRQSTAAGTPHVLQRMSHWSFRDLIPNLELRARAFSKSLHQCRSLVTGGLATDNPPDGMCEFWFVKFRIYLSNFEPYQSGNYAVNQNQSFVRWSIIIIKQALSSHLHASIQIKHAMNY